MYCDPCSGVMNTRRCGASIALDANRSLPTLVAPPQEVLVRRGLLRQIQAEHTDVNFHYARDRRVVLVRGRKERTEWSAALLQATLYGGGLDANGVRETSRCALVRTYVRALVRTHV